MLFAMSYFPRVKPCPKAALVILYFIFSFMALSATIFARAGFILELIDLFNTLCAILFVRRGITLRPARESMAEEEEPNAEKAGASIINAPTPATKSSTLLLLYFERPSCSIARLLVTPLSPEPESCASLPIRELPTARRTMYSPLFFGTLSLTYSSSILFCNEGLTKSSIYLSAS